MIKLLPLYFAVPGLLYFCLILAVFIDSLIKVIKFWRHNKIKNKDFILGFIISLLLFGILYLIYRGVNQNLSRIFVAPFLLIFLPYFFHIATYKDKKESYTYKLSVIIIVFSVVLGILKAIISNLS